MHDVRINNPNKLVSFFDKLPCSIYRYETDETDGNKGHSGSFNGSGFEVFTWIFNGIDENVIRIRLYDLKANPNRSILSCDLSTLTRIYFDKDGILNILKPNETKPTPIEAQRNIKIAPYISLNTYTKLKTYSNYNHCSMSYAVDYLLNFVLGGHNKNRI